MPDTPSSVLGLIKQTTGENDTTWGTKLNTNLDLLDEALSGYLEKAVSGSGSVTLTSTDYVSNEVRNRVIKFTGTLTADIQVNVPNKENWWIFINGTTGGYSITVKCVSGGGVTIANGKAALVYSDGVNCNFGISGSTIAPAPSSFQGATVSRTSSQSIPNTTLTTVTWENEYVDINGFWQPAFPNIFTIPTGISYVRLNAHIKWAIGAINTTRQAYIIHSAGTIGDGGVTTRVINASLNIDQSVFTAVKPVSPGQTFEVKVYQDSGGALNISSGSWFSIEAIT